MVAKVNRLPGSRELAGKAWHVYKARFWTLIGTGVVGILLTIGAFAAVISSGVLAFIASGSRLDSTVIGGGILLSILFSLALIIIWSWVGSATVLAVEKWNEEGGMRSILREAKTFIVPFFLTSLLLLFIEVGSFFVFVIPSLVFSIWFSFWQYFVVLERKSPLLALHASRELFRGRFWDVVWKVAAVHLPEIIISLMLGASGRNRDLSTGSLQLLSIALQPFYFAYTFVLFKELRGSVQNLPVAVPKRDKQAYILIPLIGVILMTVGGFLFLPRIIDMLGRTATTMYQQQESTNPSSLSSSTKIVNGLVLYYTANKQFPLSLDEAKNESILPEIPRDPKSGLPYRYTQINNGEDFKLCSPNDVEKCITSASKEFDL